MSKSHNGVAGRGPEDKDAYIRELEAKLALAQESAALARAERPKFEPLPMGEQKYLTLVPLHIMGPDKETGLHAEGDILPPGTLLPFDPAKPPKGFTGLEEGVHYALRMV